MSDDEAANSFQATLGSIPTVSHKLSFLFTWTLLLPHYEGLLSVEHIRERVVNSHRLQQGIQGIWACLCLHYRPKASQFTALLVPQELSEASHSIIGKLLDFVAQSVTCPIPSRVPITFNHIHNYLSIQWVNIVADTFRYERYI